MDSLSILLLHLVPPSEDGCSSDMLNKQPILLSLQFSTLSSDRIVSREPKDNWHCSVRGNISTIHISSDDRL